MRGINNNDQHLPIYNGCNNNDDWIDGMKITDEQLRKYIEKHTNASKEKIAAHFGISAETVRTRTAKLGYVYKKIWVMG